MATRLYLPSTGAPPISPTADAAWEKTSTIQRRIISTAKLASVMTNHNFAADGVNPSQTLSYQGISIPMRAGQAFATTDTVHFQIRALEPAVSDNFFSAMVVRILSRDGTVVRSTLFAMAAGATEWSATSGTNRVIGASVLGANYTSLLGDRVVVELGVHQTSTSTANARMIYGDDSGTDLGANETDTSAFNPYVEFSNTILFASEKEGAQVGTTLSQSMRLAS